MKSKIFLHIGMHKTGTTAFQFFCIANEQALRDQGVLYPRAGRPRVEAVAAGQHLLPWSLTKYQIEPDFWPANLSSHEDIWKNLVAEISEANCPTVVISSEEFDTLDAVNVEFVAKQLAQFDVQVIVYLRRLDDFAEAMYSTDVVYYGEKRTIEEYLRTSRTPLDYSDIATPWVESFAGKVIVNFYTPELAQSAGIVTALCDIIGIDQSRFEQRRLRGTANVGWSWYLVELCREMNEAGYPTELVVDFANVLRAAIGGSTEYDLIPRSIRAELRSRAHRSLVDLQTFGAVGAIPGYFFPAAVPVDSAELDGTPKGDHAALRAMLKRLYHATRKPSSG